MFYSYFSFKHFAYQFIINSALTPLQDWEKEY